MLVFKCLFLGLRAAPDVIVSKFFYEMKWSFVCSGIAVVSIMAMFMVPALIIFFPISMAVAASAHSLGTLHSMLVFLGLAQGYRTDFLISEIIKTSFVRGMAFSVMFALIAAVLIVGFGYDYMSVLFSDYQQFLEAESLRFQAGQLPAFVVALALFGLLTLVIEAIMAVPMAAAAYSIGPSDRTFNGFWGIGYRWMHILGVWIVLGLALLVFVGVGFDLLTEEFEIRSVFHVVASYATGTPPDFVSHPIKAPVIDSTGAEIVMLVLTIFGCWFPSFLWAATCALIFRERLAMQEQEDEDSRPTAEDHEAMQRVRLDMARDLRHARANPG